MSYFNTFSLLSWHLSKCGEKNNKKWKILTIFLYTFVHSLYIVLRCWHLEWEKINKQNYKTFYMKKSYGGQIWCLDSSQNRYPYLWNFYFNFQLAIKKVFLFFLSLWSFQWWKKIQRKINSKHFFGSFFHQPFISSFTQKKLAN